MKTLHLTEEQFTDQVTGVDNEVSRAHLEACAMCREELNHFKSTVAHFNSATLSWSEEAAGKIVYKAALTPSQRLPVRVVPWILVAACLLLFAIFPSARRAVLGSMNSSGRVQIQSSHQDFHHQVEKDNALMADIDSVLYTPVESPEKVYASQETQSQTSSNHNRTEVVN